MIGSSEGETGVVRFLSDFQSGCVCFSLFDPLAEFSAVFFFLFAEVYCLILMVTACTVAQRTRYECTAGSLTAALM